MEAGGALADTPEFSRRGSALHAEDVSLEGLAASIGTPFYCYSSSALTRRYRALEGALEGLDPLLCYSVKANPNKGVLATLGSLGSGADVVSGWELERALSAGIPPERIVFSGVGKTTDELARALDRRILQINVESEMELSLLEEVARSAGRPAPVALRTNPNVAAGTHHKISTGEQAHKFGIDVGDVAKLYRRAGESQWLTPQGLSVHIGSQLLKFEPFARTFQRLRDLVQDLRTGGMRVDSLDLGGGIGIRYSDEQPEELGSYARLIRDFIRPLGCRLIFEPGRTIVGNAGLLVTRVLFLKRSRSTNFVVVDAAMNDLHRPALYGAVHAVVPVRRPATQKPDVPVEVVGPVCETSDVLARQVALPPLQPGDLLAICSCGAYAASMASTYNSRLIAPEVLVKGEQWACVRRRQSYQELVAAESVPEWLEPADGC